MLYLRESRRPYFSSFEFDDDYDHDADDDYDYDHDDHVLIM
jgi:hypothetical protein